MSFIEHLTQEHREIEKWITTIRDADEQNKDKEDLKNMLQQLHVHMKMEEEFLFPRLKKELSAEEEVELIEDSHKEHSEAKDIMIKFLGDDDMTFAEIDELLERLLDGLVHHHNDEEVKVFPMCKERIVTARLEQITEEMATFEKENKGQFQPADLEASDEKEDKRKDDARENDGEEEDAQKAAPDSSAAEIGHEPVKPDAAKIGATPVKPGAAKIGA